MAWLRAGYSNHTDFACELNYYGNLSNLDVYYSSGGVRVALHLDLKQLASDLLTSDALASVTASANAHSSCNYSISLDSEWSSSILDRYQNWTNAFDSVQTAAIYKNSTESSGVISATYTFDTTNYVLTSFTLNGTSVAVSGTSGIGTVSGVCSYSYVVNDGNVVVTVSNASTDVEILAQIVSTDYTLNLSITAPESAGAILYLVNYDTQKIIHQYAISGTMTLSIQTVQGQTYKIIVYKPYLWSLEFGANASAVISGNSYTFTTPNAESDSTSTIHTITIGNSDANKDFHFNNNIIVTNFLMQFI